MKKIFLATTALVATAGFAAADVNFSGDASMGLKYDDLSGDVSAHYETTLYAAMSGETDGGLSFGADLTLTYNMGGAVTSATVVYIEGGFGKLSVGDVDTADEAVTGLADIGWDGLGTDNIAEALRGNSQANVLYTGTFGDFTVAASHDLGGDDYAIGFKYAMGDYSAAIAYDEAAGINAFHVQLGANVSDFSVNALYSRASDIDTTSYGIHAAYNMGAVTVSAAYSNVSVGIVDVDGYGLGIAYDLGGGASVKAGVGEVGGVTVADLGVSMSF